VNAWWSGTSALLLHWFGRETPAETYVVVVLCVLLGALALNRVSLGLGALGAFYTTALVLTPSGLFVLMAALALPPARGGSGVWIPLGCAALIFLVGVVPLTALLQKGSYVASLIAWTVVLLTVGAVLIQEPRVKQSVDALKIGIENGRLFDARRTETEWW
jgi:hypothetical protein